MSSVGGDEAGLLAQVAGDPADGAERRGAHVGRVGLNVVVGNRAANDAVNRRASGDVERDDGFGGLEKEDAATDGEEPETDGQNRNDCGVKSLVENGGCDDGCGSESDVVGWGHHG